MRWWNDLHPVLLFVWDLCAHASLQLFGGYVLDQFPIATCETGNHAAREVTRVFGRRRSGPLELWDGRAPRATCELWGFVDVDTGSYWETRVHDHNRRRATLPTLANS